MASCQRMDILMICAGPPVQRRDGPSVAMFTLRSEEELGIRMMDAVQSDLDAMYEYCKSPNFITGNSSYGRERIIRSKVNVVRLLVNNGELRPTRKAERVENSITDPEVFQSKGDLRRAVAEFLSDDDKDQAPNLMIYYSGHGVHHYNESLGRSEEALEMHVSSTEGTIHYTDSELTRDISENLPPNTKKKLYLVIDSCHAEGMLNQWELKAPLSTFVVLFAGANTEIRADYTSKGGAFTKKFVEFAQPGRQLCEIAQDILVELFDSRKKRSPAFRYAEPKLCVKKYLHKDE